jgi:molybdate transport system substrate-binding protein
MIRSRFSPAMAVTAAGLVIACFAQYEQASADSTEVKVLSAVAMKSVLDELGSEFERDTGHKVTIAYAPAGVVRDRIQGGEAFTVAILPRPIMHGLETQGRVVPGSIVVLARSAVSVCTRAGALKPDISSVEAFKKTLMASKSIAYSDPAKGGASGIHFARVLDRLGLVEEMKPKTKLTGPDSAEVVARGEAELCINQAMEILRTMGVELVGPLPPELQNTTDFVFAAGIGAEVGQPAAALALVSYLRTPRAASAFKAKGMEPGGE